MTKRQKDKKDKKTNRQKDKNTKRQIDTRQRPKREFNIVTSGQFRTIVMFLNMSDLDACWSQKSIRNSWRVWQQGEGGRGGCCQWGGAGWVRKGQGSNLLLGEEDLGEDWEKGGGLQHCREPAGLVGEGDPGEEGVVGEIEWGEGEIEGGSVTGGGEEVKEEVEVGEREGQWRRSSWSNGRVEESEMSGSIRAPTWGHQIGCPCLLWCAGWRMW